MAAESTPRNTDAHTRVLMRGALIGGAVLALLAIGLWARYGSAVFLETMATAWAYCF